MSQGARTLVIVAAILCGAVIIGLLARPQPAPAEPTRAPLVLPSPSPAKCLPDQDIYPGVLNGHYNGTVCVPD